MPQPYTVCILGAGPQGLCALKNVLEESKDGKVFVPTLFEARDRLGGLWAYSDDPNTITVLETTLGNVSRWRNCYGDFPVEDSDFDGDELGQRVGRGVYLGQKGTLKYLERYADTFDLKRWIRFNSRVVGMRRDEKLSQWEVVAKIESPGSAAREEKHLFDKVLVATGQYCKAVTPQIEGIEMFAGVNIHSQNFKRASDFSGQRVLVLGFSNTAGDIASELVGHAEKVYLSHRHGNRIFSRLYKNRPLDLFNNQFKARIRHFICYFAPVRGQLMFEKFATHLSNNCFPNLKPEWGLKPSPSLLVTTPMLTDTLVPFLTDGSVILTPGVHRISGPKTVELKDGSQLEIDAIVYCTGYTADTALMPDVEFEEDLQSQKMQAGPHVPWRLPRLFQNIFPPKHADSMAFMNDWQAPTGICELADLVAMAIVQIWKGNYSLPSVDQMNHEIDSHLSWCRAVTGLQVPPSKSVQEGKWRTWLHAAAGTGVNENLGYSMRSWRFWLTDRKFSNLMMHGIDSPHFHRLFDGRRKKWPGAREAIERANREVEEKFGHDSADPSKKLS